MLIMIDAESFRKVLFNQVKKKLERKINFIIASFPNGNSLPRSQLEKIAYSFSDKMYTRGTLIQ
jgi:hypothetical protein